MGIVHGGPPQELVLAVKDELGIDTFVETGTYKGDTAAWAAEHFARVVTIEASEQLHEHAVREHGHLPNVAFELGDSRDVLPRVVAELERPALFWLDGHWCGGETFGAEAECPLIEELAAVNGSEAVHAVFVDDARLFLCAPPRPHDPAQWPTIAEVVDAVRHPRVGRHVAVIDDVLVAVPAEAADVVRGHGQEVSTRALEVRRSAQAPDPPGRYRTWAASLLRPEARLLPGLGARLGRRPEVASAVFAALRSLPGRRLRGLAYRHVGQPLAARMEAELVIRAAGGVRMLADTSEHVGRAMAVTGLWEWNVGAVIRRLLRPGDVFVDVGANAGYYTVLARRLVGDEGRVYALEPAPETFARLRRNLELNGVPSGVVALQLAAGAEEGTALLHGPAAGHDATSSLRVERGGGTATPVAVRPLHAVLADEDPARIRLVKIDVEGHEPDVLAGLEPVLAAGARPAILVEVHVADNPGAPEAVEAFCRRRDLRARWLVEDGHADEALAPRDRRLELRDLGSPPDLSTLRRPRYALLLESG